MNLAVKDGLILNIDSINMENSNSWGNGVKLYGVEQGDGYGWNETEIKFDGIDDYVEIYTNDDVSMEDGFTFEIYAKKDTNAEDMAMLSKIKRFDETQLRFRSYISNNTIFNASMSILPSDSNWSETQPSHIKHWVTKDTTANFASEKGAYLTVTVDLKNNRISLYQNGEFLDSTQCSKTWLENSGITDRNIPFIVGMWAGFNPYTEHYTKMDLYSCRLYNKILQPTEIKDNCIRTVDYRNFLLQEKK